MSASPYEQFGVPEIVNGVGYATRVGGGPLAPEVVCAMAEASGGTVEIDDLQAAASRLIARCTGAEAGVVTCGSAAALTLAAAACLAGNDPRLMEQLPDVSACPRSEIVYPRPSPYDYDHAVRLSGARLVPVDYDAPGALGAIEAAIGPRTAAVGFVAIGSIENPDFSSLVALAHRHGLPVIVDAAVALPPAENLRSFVARGADLVAFSGGKHLGGPQASGFLCGRTDLVRSAWVQMVDMDVRPGTWSLQRWVDEGWIAHPPRHGVGRSLKVGKEAAVGLLTALERYEGRDHAAEQAAWRADIQGIYDAVKDLAGLRFALLPSGPSGQPFPALRIESGELSVRALLLALRRLPRKIILAEDEQSPDRAYLYPHCLNPGDAVYVVAMLREIVSRDGRRPPP
jgi:L-seryl-tRNA(Ser) seleniumtransferase